MQKYTKIWYYLIWNHILHVVPTPYLINIETRPLKAYKQGRLYVQNRQIIAKHKSVCRIILIKHLWMCILYVNVAANRERFCLWNISYLVCSIIINKFNTVLYEQSHRNSCLPMNKKNIRERNRLHTFLCVFSLFT